MYRRRTIGIFGGGLIALAGIILVTLVYAAFTGQLNISNGSGVGRISKWDVHFEHLSTISTIHTAKVLTQPRLASGASIDNYSVSVTSPGDTISFTVDVVNEGNYNAVLTSVSVGTPSCTGTDATSNTNVCNHLHYSLTYDNGATVQVGDTLYAKETNTMKVTLTYDDTVTASELPTSEVSISNLNITIYYQQSGDALVKDNGEVADYKVYKIGNKISVHNEDYWVIENSGAGQDYVVAFKDTFIDGVVSKYTSADNDDYANSLIKIEVDSWVNSEFLNDELKEVNGYKARLLSIDDLSRLGYGTISNGAKALQDGVPNWVYNVGERYYTMSPFAFRNIYIVLSNGDISIGTGKNVSTKVRPVINVYKEALDILVESNQQNNE